MNTEFSAVLCLLSVNLALGTFVDPNYKLAEWEGWGARIGMWSNVIGGMSDEVVQAITTALFSPKKLNLNIVRYPIGATIPGDRSCGDFSEGADLETFQDAMDSDFLEGRDSRTRKILLLAKELGVDTFEAFSYSPPSWMTRSNCSKGNPDGEPLHDNFDPKYANLFADYITEVVRYYHEKYNVSFQYVTPFFNPSSIHIPDYNREGCGMEISTIAEVIKSTSIALQNKNLTFCSLSAGSTFSINAEIHAQQQLIAMGIDRYYAKIGASDRESEEFQKRGELYTLSNTIGSKLWTSNFYHAVSRLPDITNGIILAKNILMDLKTFASSAWISADPVPGRLILFPYSDPKVENIRYSSDYYTLMQFSKHIHKGYSIVHISDGDCAAAFSASSSKLVIVCLNSESTLQIKTIDLSAFQSVGDVTAFRTSPFEPHVAISPPDISLNSLRLNLLENSITTIEISNAIAHQRTNFIRNGDFENTSNFAWFLVYGERPDGGINSNYFYRGKYSGNIEYSESKLTLMQNVTVQSSRTYHLSAWCAASAEGVVLGVLINGNQASEEVAILPQKGYLLYGISVIARESDVLSVYLHSDQGNHSAQIDYVMLH